MNNKKVVEELHAIIEKINREEILVIVEGKKDKHAMQKIGIDNVVELERKPLFAVVEEIAEKTKRCSILTDLDKKGKELYGKLKHGLQKHGVHIDDKLRNFLLKNTQIRQMEGIDNLLMDDYF